MSEVMASPDMALGVVLGGSKGSQGTGEDGQAKAPESPKTEGGDGAAPDPQGKPGTETPDSTTAEADAQASAAAKEQAEFPEDLKPFETMLKAKKWDPKAKDFAPTVLKSLSELERAHTQSATDKALLNTRQTEFQRRLSGDAKSINEYRKANGLPEIPVGKTAAEQVQERSAYLSHINNLLTSKDPGVVAASEAWLNKQLVEDVHQLRADASADAKYGSKTVDQHAAEFRSKANSVYTDHIARNPADEAVFNEVILPLAGPQGLLGSYGLDVAHVAQSPEHIKAWADLGRKIQLANNYEKALADGVAKGVDEAMAQKRRAGNAGSVGSQGKQSADAGGDGFSQSLWAARHR
jgi:hypothetical protein